jgi:hypothetical protein
MAHDRQEMLYWLEQERRHSHFSQNHGIVLPPLVAPVSVLAVTSPQLQVSHTNG